MLETVGQRIKKRRTGLKLTLEEVAELIGSSKSYVWELENKNIERPSAEKLLSLAEALQTSMSYLLGTEENFPKEELRDKIAIAAMQAVISSPVAVKQLNNSIPPSPLRDIAGWAYRMADAMLKARRATPQQERE